MSTGHDTTDRARVDAARARRRRTRIAAAVTAVALLALAVTVVVGLLVGHAAGAHRAAERLPHFHPENATQQSAYQSSYIETRRQLDAGDSPESVAAGCRGAASQVQYSLGDDYAIGLLGGCEDALRASG